MVDYRDLAPVRQVAAEAPFITEAKLRWWIFHADTNGLKAALIKIGGRVYIDRAEFSRWLRLVLICPTSRPRYVHALAPCRCWHGNVRTPDSVEG